MAETTLWWLLTGGAVAVELLTGTFYLLMLAVGLAAAAIAAHLGASTVVQIVVAALIGGGAVAGWYFKQSRNSTEPRAEANRNVNMDIGEVLQVDTWKADGTADVQYRGANWTAIHRAGVTPGAGLHRVSEIIGNRLLLDKT